MVIFALYSSIVASIKVTRSGKVRRAKLYYLRDRTGKSARITEKIKKKIGIEVDTKPENVNEENLAPASEEKTTKMEEKNKTDNAEKALSEEKISEEKKI